ncbi:cAMP-specific 3',5'-cAMP phosphodiesterase 4 [Pelomyxa schiedti]|nr:cAMP-specific 3',5'-cAMP phosphodiesterase 4 [Pelomyxa schiedti]
MAAHVSTTTTAATNISINANANVHANVYSGYGGGCASLYNGGTTDGGDVGDYDGEGGCVTDHTDESDSGDSDKESERRRRAMMLAKDKLQHPPQSSSSSSSSLSSYHGHQKHQQRPNNNSGNKNQDIPMNALNKSSSPAKSTNKPTQYYPGVPIRRNRNPTKSINTRGLVGDKNSSKKVQDEKDQGQGSGWVAVGLFIACAVVAASGAIVVSVFAAKVVESIKNQTRLYVESITASASGPVSSFCETIQPVLIAHCSDIGDALATPRMASSKEIDTYGYWYFTNVVKATIKCLRNYTLASCPGCQAYATMTDFGGPAQVLFMAQNHNSTELQEIVETYFWRLGGLGPLIKNIETAWVDVIQQVYFTARNGYSMIYPFFPLYTVQLMIPPFLSPEITPRDSRGVFWVGPYIDKVTRNWVTSVYLDLNDTRIDPNGDVGTCGMDAFVTTIVAQVYQMTNNLADGAYVVLTSFDGTLMMIQESGAADWVNASYLSDVGAFNYSEILTSPGYNSTEWNIFSNPRYKYIANAIEPTCDEYSSRETYMASIEFVTGKRFISWRFVPRSRWIVIAVIDEEQATKDDRRAVVLMISLSAVLGTTMVVAAGAVGAYSVVTRKYAGLTAKIAGLHFEIQERKLQTGNLGQHDIDLLAVSALTSDLKEIADVLREISDNPKRGLREEHIKAVRNARILLLHRNFQGVRALVELDPNQKQFVHDCGINMDQHSGLGSGRQDECDKVTPLKEDNAITVTRIPVNQWAFNVFQVANTIGEKSVLQSVFYSAILEQQLPFKLHRVNYKLLQQFIGKLEEDYCADPQAEPSSPKQENPYHNKYHAADVTQAFHCLLGMAEYASPSFRETISPLDRLACFIAAAAHDYRHPGRNNVFLRETLHPTYIKFADSPLERSHAAYALEKLLLDPECKALADLSPRHQKYVIEMVFNLINATDMVKHVELIDAIKSWVPESTTEATGGPPRDHAAFVSSTSPGKLLILQLLLKAADLSNPYRQWSICKEWATRQMKEFAQQGADERARGLVASSFMGGTATVLDLQNTFVPLFVVPLLRALEPLFPNFQVLESAAWDNLNHWRDEYGEEYNGT